MPAKMERQQRFQSENRLIFSDKKTSIDKLGKTWLSYQTKHFNLDQIAKIVEHGAQKGQEKNASSLKYLMSVLAHH